jgi:hypothetical protein
MSGDRLDETDLTLDDLKARLAQAEPAEIDRLAEIKADLETGRDTDSDAQWWLVAEVERVRADNARLRGLLERAYEAQCGCVGGLLATEVGR